MNFLLVAIAKGCDDFYKLGKTTTGVYTIDPDVLGVFDVRCDMHTTPGRTVFQRHVDGSVHFTKTGSTTKMDLEIFLVNFGLVWIKFIVCQPLDITY